MLAKALISWVGSAVGGTVVGIALFYFLETFLGINGVGLLKRQGWPWSEFYLWGLAGALAGAAGNLLTRRRRGAHAREVAEAAVLLGLDHHPVVSRADLGESALLQLFAKWYSAAHLLTGKRNGVPLQMLDYTYTEEGSEGSSYYSQTVVLLPVASDMPVFELRPRHLGIRVLGMLGVEGIPFDSTHADRNTAPVIEQFNRHYQLSLGLESELTKLGQQIDDSLVADAITPAQAAVRKLFVLDVLRYFAAHPGWYVECKGSHLALWRRQTVVRGIDRQQFLTEALEIRRVLTEPSARAQPMVVSAGTRSAEPLMIPARLGGTILGLFIGFFGGFIAFAYFFFFGDPFQLGAWRILAFFGVTLSSSLLGAFLGNRLFTRPLFAWLCRRRDRKWTLVADGPWRQPHDSTARVHQEGDQLRIVLPARGLRQEPCGIPVLWCGLWILVMVALTAVWLPAAIRGEVQGDEVVHPPVAALLGLIALWLVGIGSLLILVYRGCRHGVLVLDRGRLRIEETTLYGTKRHDWVRQELARVRAVPCERSPLHLDLCLTPRRGEPTRLLGWRDWREVQWLAGLIHERWQMTLAKVAPTPSDERC
jgi:hypothetical protein